MESISIALALEMNGKDKRSELSIGSWNSEECQMARLSLVVCFMLLAWRVQVHDRQSWSFDVHVMFRRIGKLLWIQKWCSVMCLVKCGMHS